MYSDKLCRELLKVKVKKIFKNFQGANNENQPFLWMELRALRIFDTKEQVSEVMPKVFDIMTEATGLKNDQMFILIAPMDPFYIGLEGKVFP